MKSRTIPGVMVASMTLLGTGSASGAGSSVVVGSPPGGVVSEVVPFPEDVARPGDAVPRCAAPSVVGAELPAPVSGPSVTTASGPPEYYAFSLVTTKKVPAAWGAEGKGRVTFAHSPFGVAVAADGSFVYDLHLAISELRPPSRGTFVAWVTTRNLDRVRRIGALDEDGAVRGRVAWNKFLVVVTLEEQDDPEARSWSGPVALRGMSRSGLMHTMAGHGPFVKEKCAAYGYDG